jgi:DNA-binding MarR family transcriptional regulator/N-acetylglutamate synthase-like GNAT family acetyltransferase
MSDSDVRRVRRFNRAVTRRIGILTDDYLGRGRPWAESRLMFEIGVGGADARQLRERLSLDSGYLSRLLRSLEAQGLVVARPSKQDARVRRITLTRKGLDEWKLMEVRSDDIAKMLLAPLNDGNRQRLLAAMDEVERLLAASAVKIEPEDPASDDARNCLRAYVQELERRFAAGFDPARGPSVTPAELLPPRGLFLIARLEGAAIGCLALKVIAPGVGEVKRMWVDPSVRRLSIARRLLATLEQHAMASGLKALRLDTNATQAEAIALYERVGYQPIAAYNDNPYADLWFEKRLVKKKATRSAASSGSQRKLRR